MPETITYGLVAKEDLALKQSASDTSLTVTLPDGSIVVLTKISLDELIPYGSVNLNLQQLLSMLLEILTANPSTNTKGRLYYFDGTDDVLRYMNGSGVQEVVDLAATQTLTNKTLTSPKIVTAILDTNGNEVATITPATSAVNELELKNAATGGDVAIKAKGDDTNVSLDLQTKGTGTVKANGVALVSFPTNPTTGDVIVYDGAGWARVSAANVGIVPAAVSGTPAQHGLFRENVPKAWAYITLSGGTPTVTDNFNISAITDNGAGDYTLTIDRDFTNATYAAAGMTIAAGSTGAVAGYSQAVGTIRYQVVDMAGTLTDFTHTIMLIGKQ